VKRNISEPSALGRRQHDEHCPSRLQGPIFAE
jgi:hypothetical protein